MKKLKTKKEIINILKQNLDANLNPLPTGVVVKIDDYKPDYGVVVDEVYYRICFDNLPTDPFQSMNIVNFVQDDSTLLDYLIDWGMVEYEGLDD